MKREDFEFEKRNKIEELNFAVEKLNSSTRVTYEADDTDDLSSTIRKLEQDLELIDSYLEEVKDFVYELNCLNDAEIED